MRVGIPRLNAAGRSGDELPLDFAGPEEGAVQGEDFGVRVRARVERARQVGGGR